MSVQLTERAGQAVEAGLGPAPSTERALLAYGLADRAFAGIQYDVSVVARMVGDRPAETYLCDHNCTIHVGGVPTGGSYECPAALTKNKGRVVARGAPGEKVLEGLRRLVEGAEGFRSSFFAGEFGRYCEWMQVPGEVATAIRGLIDRPRYEVTLFGGSPEIHPDILAMIGALKRDGHGVHVTMTGRRLLREPDFVERVLETPPDVIALSADDFTSPEEVERLAELDAAELRREWELVPRLYGQRQKVFEAMYVVKLREAHGDEGFPDLLFNIAVHPQNVRFLPEMLDSLTRCCPGVVLNAFPVQTAFMEERGAFPEDDLPLVERLVDAMIEQHHARARGLPVRWRFAPRLHYWLLAKSVFARFAGDHGRIADTLGGAGFWRCYTSGGAGRYVQIGAAAHAPTVGGHAGGHLGCFWNDSVADLDGPVWGREPGDLREYLEHGRTRVALEKEHPCPGCGFPRLVHDVVSMEIGLGDELRADYLDLRQAHLGY